MDRKPSTAEMPKTWNTGVGKKYNKNKAGGDYKPNADPKGR